MRRTKTIPRRRRSCPGTAGGERPRDDDKEVRVFAFVRDREDERVREMDRVGLDPKPGWVGPFGQAIGSVQLTI